MAAAPPGKQAKLQLPALDSGPVPLASIREQARRSFLDLLDSRPAGRKALLLDPSLSAPLGTLDSRLSELLSEHGVARLHYLDDRPLDDPAYNPAGADNRLLELRNVLWVLRPTLANTQRVAAQARNLRARAASGQWVQDLCVCFVPRRTMACDRILEEEGVWGDLSVVEWALELVPLEEDVISLELEGAFRDCVLDGDSTPLFYAARALMQLQAMFGLIPRLQGKGPAAVAVRDMALRMRRENPGLLAGSAGLAPRISRAILIDREVDIVTPCMTQITLEGLVDEVTGIKGGAVPWASKDKRAQEAAGGMGLASSSGGSEAGIQGGGGSTLLNSTDPFYKELRDLPYHVAISRLQAAARDARKEYEALGAKDLAQLKTFVKGLPKLLLLDRLSDIAAPVAEQVRQQLFHDRLKHELDAVEGVEQEAVVAFIEEMMFRGTPLAEVLRLLVLLSATHHGLPRRVLDGLKAELLITYGHEHALTLAGLERSGLLRVSAGGRSPFAAVRKVFRLVVQESITTSHDVPASDLSHIYKGYAPLSIRLVEAALAQPSGWGPPGSPVSEALSALPGGSYDIIQAVTDSMEGELPTAGPGHAGGTAGRTGGVEGMAEVVQGGVVLVVFLGGVTFTEISALRWLASTTNWKFLVLTTQVLTGRRLLQPFIDPILITAAKSIGLQ